MTKDEAIDREAEWKLFKAQMIRDHGSHVFKRDALGETDNMAWQDAFDGWLAAKRSIAQPAADPAPVPAQTAAGPQPIATIEFWANAYKNDMGGGHGMVVQMLNEYAELRRAAQGIDHAKRAEGAAHDAFEAWLRSPPDGEWSTRAIWNAGWQARGQQAGEAEVQKTEVV